MCSSPRTARSPPCCWPGAVPPGKPGRPCYGPWQSIRGPNSTKRAALESVVLSEWIDRITPRLAGRLSEADMTLVVDLQRDGPWKTDPPAMEQVLFNLVDNAAKYAYETTDRRVHLLARADEKSVVLTVVDHGPGVPDELRSTIFRPFEKSAQRAAETAAGVGLGLALAWSTMALAVMRRSID